MELVLAILGCVLVLVMALAGVLCLLIHFGKEDIQFEEFYHYRAANHIRRGVKGCSDFPAPNQFSANVNPVVQHYTTLGDPVQQAGVKH